MPRSILPFSPLVLLFVGACTDKGDSGANPIPGGDADTDSDSDADTDTDTDTDADTDADTQRFTILHTNDWHSHLVGYGPNAEYSPEIPGNDGTVGGVARLKSLVDEIRGGATDPVLLFDAGDWMAGDVFQLLATSHAAEMQMMDLVGYDAITLGNHEFDWGPAVLGAMISKADELGADVPIVESNTVPNTEDAADDALEAHFASGRIEITRVVELDNGLTVGLLGIMGDEAQSITPGASPASFTLQDEAAVAAVAELQAQDVDLIIAITHAGVTADPATSPDHLIAAAAPEIDVIVGGHSHTALSEPLTEGDTVIVQAGAHTRFLGQLDLAWDGTTLTVENYQLHELDDTIEGDDEVTQLIDLYVTALDEGPLGDLGFAYGEPIASVPGDVTTVACAESGMGDFVTDAYRWRANEVEGADPIDVAFESQGVVRDDLLSGSTGVAAFSDMFRVLPLGFGSDDVPGYALVQFYVTAAELRDACEVTASISPNYGCNYFVEVSGMRCTLDMERSMFNRARTVDLWDGSAWVEIDTSSDNAELYHVAVDSYVAGLMGILGGLTFDAIVITPKDASGTPYESVDDMRIDKDTVTDGVQELKLWEALIDYARSMDDTSGDGLSDVPDTYLAGAERIVGYE